jgi:thiol-disulfide isomerase/thioredoxin
LLRSMKARMSRAGPNVRGTAGALCLFLALAGTPVAAGAELESGKPVAAFRITTLQGAQITPASQRGRVLVVNLWATWCLPCREEMPAIEAFYTKHRQDAVDVVAISVDDRSEIASVRKVMAAYSYPAALAADSDLAAFGRIRQVPATFIIDRDGVLRRNGWREAGVVDLPALEQAVRPLLRQMSR